MISKRIIPVILCRGRQMVKGIRFNSWRSVGVAAQAVRVHQMRGVDELVLLDIGATEAGRGPDLELVSELATTCFMPLAVGGGVRNLHDVHMLLRAGADKVVIGSAAIDSSVVRDAARVVGSQAIVVSIDVKAGVVHGRCGTKPYHSSPDEPLGPETWAIEVQQMGAGEILLTSVDSEGTMRGYDLNLISRIARLVNIPVIAHGGCGNYEHMYEALRAGADAVAAGAMFQFTDATPAEAARYLAGRGIETRIRA